MRVHKTFVVLSMDKNLFGIDPLETRVATETEIEKELAPTGVPELDSGESFQQFNVWGRERRSRFGKHILELVKN